MDAADEHIEVVTKGLPPAKRGWNPRSVISLSGSENQLILELHHCAHASVHTGGHVWSASRQLAQWLYARRVHLAGLHVLELGAGLALPSLVAAKCGARVVATDELPLLQEHLRHNARLNNCSLDTLRLDFSSRADVEAILSRCGPFQLILFSDIVYGGSFGEALPYALARLLLAGNGAIVIGVFPAEIRAGVSQFWKEAARLLEWTADEPATSAEVDPRRGCLYTFRPKADCAAVLADSRWALEDEALPEASGLAPLFGASDDEQEQADNSGEEGSASDASSPCSVRPGVVPSGKTMLG